MYRNITLTLAITIYNRYDQLTDNFLARFGNDCCQTSSSRKGKKFSAHFSDVYPNVKAHEY